MAQVCTSHRIDAPVDKVFRIFTDLHNAARNIDGITALDVLTDGPIGVGTRFRETRTMFNKEATEEMEVTEFKENESYTVEAESCGAKLHTRFDFVPTDQGTNVNVFFSSSPVTFAAKLMTPLTFLMQGMMKKCLDGDITDLKQILEQATESG